MRLFTIKDLTISGAARPYTQMASSTLLTYTRMKARVRISLWLLSKIVKTIANLSSFSLFCKQNKVYSCVSLIELAMYLVVAVGILRERVRAAILRFTFSPDCSD